MSNVSLISARMGTSFHINLPPRAEVEEVSVQKLTGDGFERRIPVIIK